MTKAMTQTTATPRGSAQDFDFFVGTWTVRHRRLKERLKGCQDWEEFMGHSEMRKILGGLGNVDDNLLEFPGGSYRAVTLRSFDPASGQWSIWWLDGRAPGRLDVPVVGSFIEGVGNFYADDELDGRAIRVRFQWSLPEPERPRWEQAFSVDGGISWESNWVMHFERATTP